MNNDGRRGIVVSGFGQAFKYLSNGSDTFALKLTLHHPQALVRHCIINCPMEAGFYNIR